MANSIISLKLKTARIKAGFSQREVYEKLNVRQSTFSSWETGKSEPDIETFLKLCDMYGIYEPATLFIGLPPHLDHSDRELSLVKQFRALDERGKSAVEACAEFGTNYLGKVPRVKIGKNLLRPVSVSLQPAAAGHGNFIDSTDWEVVQAEAPGYADFGIKISGDSMEPLIHNGDVVWVKKQEIIENGEIGIFMLNENAYCKKLQKKGGETFLVSLNKKYAPIKIREGDSVVVYGKVLTDFIKA